MKGGGRILGEEWKLREKGVPFCLKLKLSYFVSCTQYLIKFHAHIVLFCLRHKISYFVLHTHCVILSLTQVLFRPLQTHIVSFRRAHTMSHFVSWKHCIILFHAHIVSFRLKHTLCHFAHNVHKICHSVTGGRVFAGDEKVCDVHLVGSRSVAEFNADERDSATTFSQDFPNV